VKRGEWNEEDNSSASLHNSIRHKNAQIGTQKITHKDIQVKESSVLAM
jgi:hypothetical protein